MHLFYEPEILTNGGYLNKEESHHCIKVLRHQSGDTIHVMNGKGQLVTAIIIEPSPKMCKLSVHEAETTPKPPTVCNIAVAPTKNTDRFEWFLEKSTEIGVDIITPLLCHNSERRVIKSERLNKVITAAMKQSLSTWRPHLKSLTKFSELVQTPFEGDKFIAHCHSGNEQHLMDVCKKGRNALILIGPEGDFSEEEIALAKHYQFTPVSLGAKRLRTETAALAAAHIFRLINYR